MTSVAALFAELTGKLEDLHAIAVEGQAFDALADMRLALLRMMIEGLCSLELTVKALREALDDA